MKHLDEKGFVFKGTDGEPYWCRIYEGEPWFMFWQKHDRTWMTLKRVDQTDVFLANENRMSEYNAEIYHDFHKKIMNE